MRLKIVSVQVTVTELTVIGYVGMKVYFIKIRKTEVIVRSVDLTIED